MALVSDSELTQPEAQPGAQRAPGLVYLSTSHTRGSETA